MGKILIIEDNPDIHRLAEEALVKNGFETQSAYSGTEGQLLLGMEDFDLILLDLMLPGLSGEDLLKDIRSKSNIPIIVMSAKDAIDSKVEVLESGADDYIVKPFDLKELIARIQVQLKKKGTLEAAPSTLYQLGDLVFDEEAGTLSFAGRELSLTRQESRILECFLKQPKKIFSKEEIYTVAWEDFYIGADKTINVHISNMRKKLLEQTGKEWIQTVWGVGFRLDPEEMKPEP